MFNTDKHGNRVDVRQIVQIPFFPEYEGKYYEITTIEDISDMYGLTEVDKEGEFVPGAAEFSVEPWKVEIV